MSERDKRFIGEAIMLGTLCPPSEKAFSVGCVIVDANGKLVGSGYSREWGDGWHAEEIALEKARREGTALKGATLYSSIEPCHPRQSGKKSCAQHIIDAGIARVVFCMKEPPVYVDCHGQTTLQAAGLAVEQDDGLQDQVKKANPGRF